MRFLPLNTGRRTSLLIPIYVSILLFLIIVTLKTAQASDPTCATGIQRSNVCCITSCTSCGGPACNTGGLGPSCCMRTIRSAGVSCADSGPPCLIGLPSTPSSSPSPPSPADPLCGSGILNWLKNVCCPASCRRCGGKDCSERPGGVACCPYWIQNNAELCDVGGPPCVLKPAADPECRRGVLNGPGDVCCASTCSSCGGGGAACDRGRNSECCPYRIRDGDSLCVDSAAPCLMPSASPSASPSVPTPTVMVGDENCETGVRNKLGDACCPVSCGKCGGKNCEERGPSERSCCPYYIRNMGITCSVKNPPCWLPLPTPTSSYSALPSASSPSQTPSPSVIGDPTCATGVSNGDICCPEECGTCGGPGCRFRAPQKACCGRRIRDDDISCDVSFPPCLINLPIPSATPSTSTSVSPSISSSVLTEPTSSPSAIPVSPSPSPSTMADPICATGVTNGELCCPAICGTCGGLGCRFRAPKKACCETRIRNNDISCDNAFPPCLITLPSPSPSGSVSASMASSATPSASMIVPSSTLSPTASASTSASTTSSISSSMSAEPTSTPSASAVSPTPSSPVMADPMCATGVSFGVVCCPQTCGTCGGRGCKLRARNGACCRRRILKSEISCDHAFPPCLLTVPSPSPAPSMEASMSPAATASASMIVPSPVPSSTSPMSPSASVEPSMTSSTSAEPTSTPSASAAMLADPLCLTGVSTGSFCCPAVCEACGGPGCMFRAPDRACCTSRIRSNRISCDVALPPCLISTV